MKLASTRQFQSVQEWHEAFLTLWPHRYDYLWAEHPNPGERPDWQTESRFPLSDRVIQQGVFLYGVRFGDTTRYILIDIDKGSLYHPSRDRFAWKRILAVLEPIGLVQAVGCTSSYSGGLHLYLPFEEEQKTWEIALVVKTLLANAGFKLTPGQLEVFPNCKPYATDGNFGLYNGHRLPMQAGSYLLNADLQPIWSDQQTFVQHWQFAQQRNSIEAKAIDRILKSARRKQHRLTHRADKFFNNLNTEIDQGWTGPGQTNRLLGRIAMRSYIFGHVGNSDTPLEGQALIEHIIHTACQLPGYTEWCRHQHEIEKRAEDWARAIEQSHYYHYGSDRKRLTESTANDNDSTKPNHNEQTRLDARERIRLAIANLLDKAALPVGITERFKALLRYQISGQTLYRHRDLWHPRHLQIETIGDLQGEAGQDCSGTASCPDNHTNLLVANGCNPLTDMTSSHSEQENYLETGCNSLPGEDFSRSEPRNMTTKEGVAYIKQVLAQVKARNEMEKAKKRERYEGRSQVTIPLLNRN